jgi:arylsulfatase A-like enzyme
MNPVLHFMRMATLAVATAALPAVAFTTGTTEAAPEVDTRPNVIVIIADDLGWADVGFHGNTEIATPSLDRLAAEGMELNRFYTTPICTPTRAALMTGRDPMRMGVAYGVIQAWDNHGVNPEEHFMPQSFLAAGYQTAMVGKWHLGHSQPGHHPNNRGFEHFYGHLQTEVGFYPPFSKEGGLDFQRNGESIHITEGYETFLLGDEVERFIRERDPSRPFFVYMPFIAPHTPLDAPQDLQDKYKDINTDLEKTRSPYTDSTRRTSRLMLQPSARPMYAAVTDAMDQAIGQVLNALDDEGMAENTIVLFHSDNGGAAYSVGGADNVPLRGGKGDTYEGGVRVVSVLRWPGRVEANSKLTDIMTVMDVFPTLADAAGIEKKNSFRLDGRSMWPAIAEGKRMQRDDYVFFISEIPDNGYYNITGFNEEWKLVQTIDQKQTSVEVHNQLFRIHQDPYEYADLADQHPEVVEMIAQKINEWRATGPINAVRNSLVPPPGWRAPRDWATYIRPEQQLQSRYASELLEPDPEADRALGQMGRLNYDCTEDGRDMSGCY